VHYAHENGKSEECHKKGFFFSYFEFSYVFFIKKNPFLNLEKLNFNFRTPLNLDEIQLKKLSVFLFSEIKLFVRSPDKNSFEKLLEISRLISLCLRKSINYRKFIQSHFMNINNPELQNFMLLCFLFIWFRCC